MNDVMAKSDTAELLRQEIFALIDEGRITRSKLAEQIGVQLPVLSRFLNDEDRDIYMKTADRLAAAIGLRFELIRDRSKTPEKISG